MNEYTTTERSINKIIYLNINVYLVFIKFSNFYNTLYTYSKNNIKYRYMYYYEIIQLLKRNNIFIICSINVFTYKSKLLTN